MKQIITLIILFAFSAIPISAFTQCPPGQIEVEIEVSTDNWGYEAYIELVPAGNPCGTGAIFSGGNATQVGCSGGGDRTATAGGYASNSTITEGPFCLTEGAAYDLIAIDDWGDGGTEFTIFIDGFPMYGYHASGPTVFWSFLANGPLNRNAATESIDVHSYITMDTITIAGTLYNYGRDTISSLDINYDIDGLGMVTENLTGLSLLPFTALSYSFVNKWITSTDADYSVRVWTSNVNGMADEDTSNDTLVSSITKGQPIPNIIDDYVGFAPSIDVLGSSSNQLSTPRDLDFHPNLSKSELWVVNKETEASGGSTVTFSDAGKPSQSSVRKEDANAWHFMSLTTGIAFSENSNFATSPGVYDANHNGGDPFTGPSLWSSDPAIYAMPSGGNGSHLDMLHESPNSMGITHEADNAFWLFDGYNNEVVWYDFKEDHGPGNDDHSDGEVLRVTDFSVSKIDDHIVSHLHYDKPTGWLYIVDNGNKRIIRMDANSGTIGGTPSFGPYETLALYSNLSGTTWEVIVDSGLVQPAGIHVIDDRMIVTDHSNGDIIIYDLSTSPVSEKWRLVTGSPGIMGVTLGPDGYIWYVNASTHQLVKVEIGSVSTDPSIKHGLTVYPNPSTGLINILSAHEISGGLEIQLLDLRGGLLDSKTLNTGKEFNLDYHNVSSGIYFLKIARKDGFVQTEKLVIRK